MGVSYPPPNRFISIDGVFINIQAITYVKTLENNDVEITLTAESKTMVLSGNSAKNLIEFLKNNSELIEN
jgi:hypothetical protein